MEPHPPHPRRDPFLAWLAVSALIAATTFGADWSGLDWSAPDDRLLPRSLALALAAGFGLSMPLTCLWVNRGALRRMLRPTAGRILTAVLLAQLVPLGYLEMPVYPWGIVAVMALGSTDPFPRTAMTAALLVPVVFLPLLSRRRGPDLRPAPPDPRSFHRRGAAWPHRNRPSFRHQHPPDPLTRPPPAPKNRAVTGRPDIAPMAAAF